MNQEQLDALNRQNKLATEIRRRMREVDKFFQTYHTYSFSDLKKEIRRLKKIWDSGNQ